MGVIKGLTEKVTFEERLKRGREPWEGGVPAGRGQSRSGCPRRGTCEGRVRGV